MEDKVRILPFETVSGHIHQSWVEISREFEGVIIMCPEGCRRMLTTKGEVLDWDAGESLWVKR